MIIDIHYTNRNLETFSCVLGHCQYNFSIIRATHHVCSIDRRGHLDFPEVLAIWELIGATDGCCATAVIWVKAHLPVVTAEEGSIRLEVLIPHPVKTWEHKHNGYSWIVRISYFGKFCFFFSSISMFISVIRFTECEWDIAQYVVICSKGQL